MNAALCDFSICGALENIYLLAYLPFIFVVAIRQNGACMLHIVHGNALLSHSILILFYTYFYKIGTTRKCGW